MSNSEANCTGEWKFRTKRRLKRNQEAHNVIEQIFPRHAVTLGQYLKHMLGPDFPLERQNDPVGYLSLLRDTMVVSDLSKKTQISISDLVCHEPISEVLHRIVAKMVRATASSSSMSSSSSLTVASVSTSSSSSTLFSATGTASVPIGSASITSHFSVRDQNCLSLGYRSLTSEASIVMRGNKNVECRAANTGHPMLCTSSWQLLLNRIGELQFRDLLDCPVFLKSVNGSYLQVSGTLASELAYRQQHSLPSSCATRSGSGRAKRSISALSNTATVEDSIHPLKRTSADNSTFTASTPYGRILSWSSSSCSSSTSSLSSSRAGNTTLPRYKMFYNHRSATVPGLPAVHPFLKVILNTMFCRLPILFV
jgi:hypothetical protein